MSIFHFTDEEIEEMKKADAEIEAEFSKPDFKLTTREIRFSSLIDSIAKAERRKIAECVDYCVSDSDNNSSLSYLIGSIIGCANA